LYSISEDKHREYTLIGIFLIGCGCCSIGFMDIVGDDIFSTFNGEAGIVGFGCSCCTDVSDNRSTRELNLLGEIFDCCLYLFCVILSHLLIVGESELLFDDNG
jgi:hypothetical protein